jgi:hypothetical protein
MTKPIVRFCWLCGKKLYGNHSEELTVDHHPRTLHKTCAKDIKTQYDHIKRNGQYFSMYWEPSGSSED